MSTQIVEKTDTLTKLLNPKKYNVIMYNDDFTTMEFVIFLLKDLFGKDDLEAQALTILIHDKGEAVVGNYIKEIALTKVQLCLQTAKKYEFPLLVKAIEE